jgi:hypothetical protein
MLSILSRVWRDDKMRSPDQQLLTQVVGCMSDYRWDLHIYSSGSQFTDHRYLPTSIHNSHYLPASSNRGLSISSRITNCPRASATETLH